MLTLIPVSLKDANAFVAAITNSSLVTSFLLAVNVTGGWQAQQLQAVR